jgi:hypothetical protein
MKIKKVTPGALVVLSFLFVCTESSYAQQKKGDKEVLVFASDFSFGFGGDFKPRDLSGSGSFGSLSNSQQFSLGGELGYFLTRKNEVGGGVSLSAFRSSTCRTSFSDGQIIDKSCDSGSSANLGLSVFYRYNFGKEDARGFPFIGASIGAASVSSNFTGNVRARPFAGYKYFLKKSVALDLSVGYTLDVNKVSDESSFFIVDRRRSLDGRVGFSFVF